ncbi:MAG: TIGR01212 family radical SAM protein [Lachnospiraceae bacterium]|nr:TIGR01212 family radical SAM protein [Lachnospiraceae bacterium]
MTDWHGKPYYSIDAYCKNTYHYKLYKIALNAHLTCPNRDGSLDFRGCIFCSAGGSGDFAVPLSHDIDKQLADGLALFGTKRVGEEFIAYFQAFTNTYGPLPYLEQIYRSALEHPKIRGISIATRPDCVGEPVIALLQKLQSEYHDKFIWVELGLQTIHEKTAASIRRGYDLPVFADAYDRLSAASLPVIVHLILGLPGESDDQILESVDYVSSLRPFGVKLQLLHILRGTDLAKDYDEGKFEVLTKDAYLTLLSQCIAHLDPSIVIHRVTGDGKGEDLIAPDWSRNKKDVLNSLHHLLKIKGITQGCHEKRYN